jgi:CheY-like chemotaxis protein
MDVFMPGIGGIAAARQIKASRPATIVVLVSTTHPEDLPGEAAASPADEIVWKRELRPSLLEEIWQRHRA